MFLVSRYVLPHIFRSIARLPELVLVGALAWCFLGGELAEELHLSREMGALIAGVSLSTFPYALDVTAKVTSLRDFEDRDTPDRQEEDAGPKIVEARLPSSPCSSSVSA